MIERPEEEWKKVLTTEQFRVLREKGTEAPFSGEYETCYRPGSYTCAACDAQLFSSETKFDAGCGWPSFFGAIDGAVQFKNDDSHGMIRAEVACANCGGHLGHVFDGEKFGNPVNRRFCINSVSLRFLDN